MTIGISVLSLALLFEVYGDVPLGPFLGVLFYEFARDMEEDADEDVNFLGSLSCK
jgi:hypothetical protein